MYDCCIKKDKRKNKQTNKKQRKNATTTTATRNSDLWVASVLLLTSTLSVFHITSFVFERVIAQNHSTTLIPIHPEELAAQFAKWRCSPMFFFVVVFFSVFFFFDHWCDHCNNALNLPQTQAIPWVPKNTCANSCISSVWNFHHHSIRKRREGDASYLCFRTST